MWDALAFAPLSCATHRKLLHADWTGMSQCLHTTGSEVGAASTGCPCCRLAKRKKPSSTEHMGPSSGFSPERFCSALAMRFNLALQLSGVVKAVTQRSVRAVDQGL